MALHRRPTHALVLVLLGLVAACCARADAPGQSLRILLTNDDGHEAPGLGVLRAALEADGHDVIVVAPSEDQSGSSVSYTSRGKLTWRKVDPKRTAVDGTPADCIRLAVS